jgi:AcrR family transcriptional regulator
MPKLWTDTIEAHRHAVREAILDTTAALVTKRGLASVTMSQIAEETGIGRATLYKYFPDVDTILLAWHERQIAHHFQHLTMVRDQTEDEGKRLEAVLKAYALVARESRGHHEGAFATLLHRGEHVARAKHQVHDLVRDLIVEAAEVGAVRDDVAPDELASYCISALAAAGDQSSKDAVLRLVKVTVAGLQVPR